MGFSFILQMMYLMSIVLFQKISIPLPQNCFFGLNHPPLWKFQFSFILSFKHIFDFSNDRPVPWDDYHDYEYFLELHIASAKYSGVNLKQQANE